MEVVRAWLVAVLNDQTCSRQGWDWGHPAMPWWSWDLLILLAISHTDLQFHLLAPCKYSLKEYPCVFLVMYGIGACRFLKLPEVSGKLWCNYGFWSSRHLGF